MIQINILFPWKNPFRTFPRINIWWIILLIFIFSSLHCTSSSQKKIKIACIGDSITYGYGVADREHNAFPAQLQAMLGNKYLVRNYGVSGTTLLTKGNHPYIQTSAYQEALKEGPDIVFIKLGTNDSKTINRPFLDNFAANYQDLISSFQSCHSDVRIILLLPLPAFTQDSNGIFNPIINQEINLKIRKVAFEIGIEIVDLNPFFVDKPHWIPDGIHPCSLGATAIAERLFELLSTDYCQSRLPSDLKDYAPQNFFGYPLYNFSLLDFDCKLVLPKKSAYGRPWILRSRFFGHEPQADIALLERGFTLAYADVANLYGNSVAIDRWNKFYAWMIDQGFHHEVVIEAMSRGGLVAYNWAASHPDKVACIYADAPVLDGKSWPKGDGLYEGSPRDWEGFKQAYGLESKMAIQEFADDPIHKTDLIVKGGYPMLHIIGEVDAIVPVAENTIPFAEKILQKGGSIEVISKPGIGHHPHSLENPAPIVDFILRATKRKINLATLAIPSGEYRSGAGWIARTTWWTQARDIDSLCQNTEKVDLLLLGNSITQGFGGIRPHTTYAPGKKASEKYFGNLVWINAGISGDRTQNILYRLQHGHYPHCQPKMISLCIGVNNFSDNTANEIIDGTQSIISRLKKHFTNNPKILLFGPLPTGTEPLSIQRKKWESIHHSLNTKYSKSKENVYYINMSKEMLTTDGSLNPVYFSADGIHLKPDGYEIWANKIRTNFDLFNK